MHVLHYVKMLKLGVSPLVLLTLGCRKDDKKHDSEPLHRSVGHLHLL